MKAIFFVAMYAITTAVSPSARSEDFNPFANQDPKPFGCQIEFKYDRNVGIGNFTYISGAATCERGRVILRLYDIGGNFIGTETAFIEGYAFKTIVRLENPPQTITIKAAIYDVR